MRTIVLPQNDNRQRFTIGGGPGAPIFEPGPQTRIYRAPVRAICTITCEGHDETWGQVMDISLGGCLLKADAEYEVGTMLDIRITIIGMDHRAIANVRGRVRRRDSEAGHSLWGIELVAETREERRVHQWLYSQALR